MDSGSQSSNQWESVRLPLLLLGQVPTKGSSCHPLSNVEKIRVHRVRVQSFCQQNVHPVLIQKQNNSSNSDDIFAYVDTSYPSKKIGYG
jgi:hypothetical protein